MEYVLALDQGTTSSRAILFNQAGTIAATAQHEFQQFYPQAGWVEHDPAEILSSQFSCAVEALGKIGARPRDIAAIGITNQRETVIIWDRATGKADSSSHRLAGSPYSRALQGAGRQRRGRSHIIANRPGHRSLFLRHQDCLDSRPRAGRPPRAEQGELAFGTVDCWLIWHLTSGHTHVTDVTNASRTLLYNIVKGEWDEELLKIFNIPAAILPNVAWSCEKVGEVTTRSASAASQSPELPATSRPHSSANCAGARAKPKNTYGTGCFLLQNVGTKFVRSRHRLITTIAASTSRRLEYALEGSIFIGGAVVQWLRDNLKLIGSSADVEALAASVPDAGGVVFVPAFVGLGAPHWDAHAAGMLIGLRRDTKPAHIARAALEAIAFQVADVLEAVHERDLYSACGLARRWRRICERSPDAVPGRRARRARRSTASNGNNRAWALPILRGWLPDSGQSPDALRAGRKSDKRFEPQMAAGECDRTARAMAQSRRTRKSVERITAAQFPPIDRAESSALLAHQNPYQN